MYIYIHIEMHQAPDFRADLGDRARSNHTALIVLLPQECSDSISTQICFWSIIGNRCLINRRGGGFMVQAGLVPSDP